MVGTWCFEETKLLIALWSEEVVQHELNTMHNKKLVWDKISQRMEGPQEVHNSVVLKLTTSSKNIARLAKATKFMETNYKNERCLNQ